MPSSKRKQQARITFTPIPSSSPAVQGYNAQIQARAAAVGYGDASQSSKRRKLQSSVPSDAASQNTPADAMLPTPEDLAAIQDALSGDQKKSKKKQAKQKRLDFGPSSGTVNLEPPTAPNMFAKQRGQKRTADFSSDESDNIPTKQKGSKKHKTSFMSPAGKKVSKKSRKQKDPTPPQESDEDDEIVVTSARKAQAEPTPQEEEDEEEDDIVVPSARKPRRPQPQMVVMDDDDSEDELPTNIGTQRGRRRTRQSSVLSSSPPAATAKSDDDLQIIENPHNKEPSGSDDEEAAPKTPGRRRLQPRKRQMTQQEQEEQDDLDEDMDFIGPSSDVDEDPAPRDSQTLKKNARLQALERLKQVRSSQKAGLPDIREDEEEDDDAAQRELDDMYDNSEDSPEPAPTSSRAMFDADEDDEDFIEEGDDDTLGVPDGVPIAFTRYASMKAKDLWKFAIEWMVQKKINPAFNMDDEIYNLTFQKLDDEVSGLVGSKFASSAWTSEFHMALHSRPEIAYNTIDRHTAEHAYRDKCDACNRTGHPATREVQFQGKPYHRQTLDEVGKDDTDSDDEEDNDDDSSSDSAGETAADRPAYDAQGRVVPPANKVWYVGKFCMSNARTAHALHHWRYHLYEWVVLWIDGHGYSGAKELKKRDKMSTKKKRKYANKIVDRMADEGVLKKLWKEFRGTIDEASNAKTGRFEGGSP